MVVRAVLLLTFILTAPAALAADVWTCQGICGALTNEGGARLRTGISSGAGVPITATGGSAGASATALEAYNAASASCTAQTSGRLPTLGRASDSGVVVFASVADICVKNS